MEKTTLVEIDITTVEPTYTHLGSSFDPKLYPAGSELEQLQGVQWVVNLLLTCTMNISVLSEVQTGNSWQHCLVTVLKRPITGVQWNKHTNSP